LIDHLRESRNASTVAVWGRSMGAVTALLHAAKDPTVSGIVCDSAFSNLRMLCEELVSSFISMSPPKIAVNFALNRIRATVQQKAEFDIDELVPLNSAPLATTPAFFISAESDNLVNPHHTQYLLEKYGGEAMFVEVTGDHNTSRDSLTMNQIGAFLFKALQCEILFGDACPLPTTTMPPLFKPKAKTQLTCLLNNKNNNDNNNDNNNSTSSLSLPLVPPSISDITEAPTPVADVDDKEIEPADSFCMSHYHFEKTSDNRDKNKQPLSSLGIRMVPPERDAVFETEENK